MKKIKELNLGFSDAQNYLQRSNKQMFSEVFVKNDYLDNLLQPNTFFLIGEKGTGKTAYATFLCNSEQKNNKSILKFIGGTDYEKFYELKKRKQIDISGYADVWMTIIFLLLSTAIKEDDKVISPFNRNNLSKLIDAIDEYYHKAFSPEIVNALKIVDDSKLAAKIFCEHAEVGAEKTKQNEFTEQRLQMNLYYICQKFSECLKKTKLTKNITLYIDGIDIRPSTIPYSDYLECIKGLANACWKLNTELFSNVKDSKGQLKVVLLLRPDIFNSLNLQNASNKLSDNSVFLEWRTTYKDYPTSNLYKMANKLLSYDQGNCEEKSIWDMYFPWKLRPSNPDREFDTAFMEFLKISLSRPRDIQSILKILQNLSKQKGVGEELEFDQKIFFSDEFQNQYSEYFMSSLKDQLSFYYSDEDYRHFRKFFDYFENPDFTYDEFKINYNKFTEYILDNAKDLPQFVVEPKEFLQLLYDSNMIAAVENNGTFFHFSYREKNSSNISPQVPIDINITYKFHYGMYKKTKLGRY